MLERSLAWRPPHAAVAFERALRALRGALSAALAPAAAIAVFVGVWALAASQIEASIGRVPGPLQVVEAARGLAAEHRAERAKQAAFEARMEERRLAAEAAGEAWKPRRYAGAPTFLDQIATSLRTVFAGFLVASAVALPLGILCGSSKRFYAAMNPLIQLFRPVSPLAWLPLVMILVSGLYTAEDPWLSKSFVSSAVTVALCSLWPTLVNTALGVASVERDHWNVARVLQLPWHVQITKIVLPSALPWIFSGLRLSLGVGWMVLIAAEMLAQNPGLGKFVWDNFQSGSSDALSRILVAVLVIGSIGFALDRIMTSLHGMVSHEAVRA
jgi:nitrate/nitrite transport system permease protein